MGLADVLLNDARTQLEAFVEECVGGRPHQELGLVQSSKESFRLADDDTVTSIKATHRQACATARAVVADFSLDTVVTGHRAGPRTVHWVYLQVLRDLVPTAASWSGMRHNIATTRPPAERGR